MCDLLCVCVFLSVWVSVHLERLSEWVVCQKPHKPSDSHTHTLTHTHTHTLPLCVRPSGRCCVKWTSTWTRTAASVCRESLHRWWRERNSRVPYGCWKIDEGEEEAGRSDDAMLLLSSFFLFGDIGSGDHFERCLDSALSSEEIQSVSIKTKVSLTWRRPLLAGVSDVLWIKVSMKSKKT